MTSLLEIPLIASRLSADEALLKAEQIIRSIDGSAHVEVYAGELVLDVLSENLESVVRITAFAIRSEGAQLYVECVDADRPFWTVISSQFQASEPADEESEVSSLGSTPAEILSHFMTKPNFRNYVELLPSAYDSAESSPYNRLNRLESALTCLAIFACMRSTRKGATPLELAQEAGLGNIYRERISRHTANKYGHEYTFTRNGAPILMQEHLTLGGGGNDKQCLSIHFQWDAARRRIVVGHVGRHLTCTLSNS